MLKKLLKHEWIATGRKYGLFYLVLAAVTIFTVFVWKINIDSTVVNVVQGIFFGIYIITLIGVWFCSVGLAVIRFYKNMVSEEGYLTFTLPAKVEELVLAKFLVAMAWQLLTVVGIVLSLGLVVMSDGFGNLKMLLLLITEGLEETGMALPLFCVMMAVSMIYQMLLYYLSIAIGQIFSGNKIAGSIVGYLIINFVMEMLMVAIMLTGGMIAGFENMDAYMNTETGMQMLVCGICMLMLVIAAVEYFATCRLLKKKLNLT